MLKKKTEKREKRKKENKERKNAGRPTFEWSIGLQFNIWREKHNLMQMTLLSAFLINKS